MTTRRASDDSAFRQERYMSAPEMTRGLLANCVAARVQALPDPAHRKLVWWLQKVSWQPGGLEKLASEIIAFWPKRFATKTMQRLGVGPDRIYSAKEVREVRNWAQLEGDSFWTGEFMLRSEDTDLEEAIDAILDSPSRISRETSKNPDSYPASAFSARCLREAKRNLAKFLFEQLCLNPAVRLNEETLWYFPQLVETLQELHDLRAAEAASAAPVTQIGERVQESLEYALAERGLVVIDGVARTGKTFAVKAWCDAHPGEARYVQVPPSNDDLGFYRALCAGLGIGASSVFKTTQLREKIEATLQKGDLLLVLDEGHYLFCQRNLRNAMPYRINWMLTQLVNMGVPVAVVTTPQFTKNQERLVKHGGWSSEQLTGRIMHYERLPDSLAEADLEAVATHWLPEGDADSIRTLIAYAQSSEKYLQAIESLVRRSHFVAKKSGRPHPNFADVAAALQSGVIPSDNALAAARIGAQPGQRRKVAPVAVPPTVSPSDRSLRPTQPITPAAFPPPVRDTSDAVLLT